MRTQKWEQAKRRKTTYGLRTFSYLGSKLWNLLANESNEVNDIDYERLKFVIKYWPGPNHDSAQGHFLWSTFCVLHVCYRNHFFINLIAHTPRAADCRFDDFVITGGIVGSHYDNLRCHQWWRGCQVDDLLFLECDIALYILALFICRILTFWLMLFVVHTTLDKFSLILILSYLKTWSGQLTHWGRVTHTCVIKLGRHRLREWPVAFSVPSHYLNPHRIIVKWTISLKEKQF